MDEFKTQFHAHDCEECSDGNSYCEEPAKNP